MPAIQHDSVYVATCADAKLLVRGNEYAHACMLTMKLSLLKLVFIAVGLVLHGITVISGY